MLFFVANGYSTYRYSYPERLRDWPNEARQPVLTHKVPIPAEPMFREMRVMCEHSAPLVGAFCIKENETETEREWGPSDDT